MTRYLELLSAMAERDQVFVNMGQYALMTAIPITLFLLLSRWERLPEKWRTCFHGLEQLMYAYALASYLVLFWMTVQR